MKAETIEAIQKIEAEAQMQICGQGYLDLGHSIFPGEDEFSDVMFHGWYTDYNSLPIYLAALNGCHLDDIAQALRENDRITEAELNAAMAYYR